MRRIAVINQKGGVGKTTTTVNLGAALARLGQRVLVCDLDPQCNLTVHLDADPSADTPSLYELLHGKAGLHEVVRPTRQPGLDLAPASIDLAGIELELVNAVGRETLLRDAFAADAARSGPRWDIVLVDCPPSLGLLSLNALVACNEVFVPIQAEFFALQGLGKLHEVVDLVQRRLNPALAITGMVSCRHDPSTNLGRQVMADIGQHFGDVLFRTLIRRNVKLAEAPSHGRTIFEYDPESRGAEDYLQLAQELLARHATRAAPEKSETKRAPAVAPATASASAPAPAPAPTPTPAPKSARVPKTQPAPKAKPAQSEQAAAPVPPAMSEPKAAPATKALPRKPATATQSEAMKSSATAPQAPAPPATRPGSRVSPQAVSVPPIANGANGANGAHENAGSAPAASNGAEPSATAPALASEATVVAATTPAAPAPPATRRARAPSPRTTET